MIRRKFARKTYQKTVVYFLNFNKKRKQEKNRNTNKAKSEKKEKRDKGDRPSHPRSNHPKSECATALRSFISQGVRKHTHLHTQTQAFTRNTTRNALINTQLRKHAQCAFARSFHLFSKGCANTSIYTQLHKHAQHVLLQLPL